VLSPKTDKKLYVQGTVIRAHILASDFSLSESVSMSLVSFLVMLPTSAWSVAAATVLDNVPPHGSLAVQESLVAPPPPPLLPIPLPPPLAPPANRDNQFQQ